MSNGTEHPTTYAYDLAVAELAATVEALWVQCDRGLISQRYVLEIQAESDTALCNWAGYYGITAQTKEDLVEVLRELRESNAKRFLEEVNNGESIPR